MVHNQQRDLFRDAATHSVNYLVLRQFYFEGKIPTEFFPYFLLDRVLESLSDRPVFPKPEDIARLENVLKEPWGDRPTDPLEGLQCMD